MPTTESKPTGFATAEMVAEKKWRERFGCTEPERLVELRRRYQRSQEECATQLGIGQSSYARMESGQTPIRRRDRLALALMYGIRVNEAFPWEPVVACPNTPERAQAAA